MIDRICISINNCCNLSCTYCHFRDKKAIPAEKRDTDMDVLEILQHVKDYARHVFKIGFVGSGEPLLDIACLKKYIRFIADNKWIKAYTITNGTVDISDEDILFLVRQGVNVGFSLDGYKELHDKFRCDTFDKVMINVMRYKNLVGKFPSFNATVGRETIKNAQKVIAFFEGFDSKVTFSRMIGEDGISLQEYHDFMKLAEERISVRRGGMDCTMYGGQCGAGVNNYYFANGKIYFCGNCVNLAPIADSSISFAELEKIEMEFDRNFCYKESFL